MNNYVTKLKNGGQVKDKYLLWAHKILNAYRSMPYRKLYCEEFRHSMCRVLSLVFDNQYDDAKILILQISQTYDYDLIPAAVSHFLANYKDLTLPANIGIVFIKIFKPFFQNTTQVRSSLTILSYHELYSKPIRIIRCLSNKQIDNKYAMCDIDYFINIMHNTYKGEYYLLTLVQFSLIYPEMFKKYHNEFATDYWYSRLYDITN